MDGEMTRRGAKTSGHLLHIILGGGQCGGNGAQRSEITIANAIIIIIHDNCPHYYHYYHHAYYHHQHDYSYQYSYQNDC